MSDAPRDPLEPVIAALDAGRPPPLAWVLRWQRDVWTGAARDPLTAAWRASDNPYYLRALLFRLRPAVYELDPALGCRGDAFGLCCEFVCRSEHGFEGPRRCVGVVVTVDDARCDRCVRRIRTEVGDHGEPTLAELLSVLASAKNAT